MAELLGISPGEKPDVEKKSIAENLDEFTINPSGELSSVITVEYDDKQRRAKIVDIKMVEN